MHCVFAVAAHLLSVRHLGGAAFVLGRFRFGAGGPSFQPLVGEALGGRQTNTA